MPNLKIIQGPRKSQVVRISVDDEDILFDVENLAILRGSAALVDSVLENSQQAQHQALRAPFLQAAPQAPKLEHRVISKMTIGNTLRCNLRCSYCYNGSEAAAKTTLMSAETGQQAVDALLEQQPLPGRLALLFIGGESLLDRPGIQRTLKYARRKARPLGVKIEAVVYTNGVLMKEEILDWAIAQHISLVISLDGPPTEHDRFRVFANGQGSAKLVLDNIRELMRRKEIKTRRVRAVSQAGDSLHKLHRYLYELGFNDIYVQSLFDKSGYNKQSESADLHALVKWYKSLLLQGIVISVHPFEQILSRLSKRGHGLENWTPCSAGVDSLGLNHDGQIVPCHHFFAESGQRLGSIQHGLGDISQRRPYYRLVSEREPCASCWARHLCGGECYHRAITAGLDYSGVVEDSCDRKREEIALALELWTDVARRRPSILPLLQSFKLTRPAAQDSAYASSSLQEVQGHV